MTVLWPGVLGCLCLVYVLLEGKRRLIERSFNRSGGLLEEDLVQLDPFHVAAPLFKSRTIRRTAELLCLFPMIAIAAHIFMLAIFVVALGWSATLDPMVFFERYSQSRPNDLGVYTAGAWFSLSTALFSVIGFFGALIFWRTVRQVFRPRGLGATFPALSTARDALAEPVPPSQRDSDH